MRESEKSIFFSCREIAVLDPARGITLVQHETARRIYIKKKLTGQSAGVYRWLLDHRTEGLPEVVQVVRIPSAGQAGDPASGRTLREYGTAAVPGELPSIPGDCSGECPGDCPGDCPGEYALEEYVSGQTLREILDNGNLFPVEEAVDIVEQLCRTLQALHSALPPITGCDLSPSNILLTSDGFVRIRDLRSARQIFSDMPDDLLPPVSKTIQTRPQTRLRTRRSKAGKPVFSDRHVKAMQTDLCALGSLFCQLLTGHLPENQLPDKRSGQYPDLQSLLQDLDACRPHPTIDHSITSDSDTADSASRNHPYLLPGFRSGNPLHYLAALFAYILLIRLSLTFTPDKFPTGYQMWAARLVFFLGGLIILLFTGNYMDVWRHLRITRIRIALLRLLAVLIIDAALFMLTILAIIFTGLALGVYHSSLF